MLSKRLTDIPGSSDVFECGMTTYSNQMKSALLGVSPKFIEENGAVSEIVAREMARGVLRTSHADLSLSIAELWLDPAAARLKSRWAWFGWR